MVSITTLNFRIVASQRQYRVPKGYSQFVWCASIAERLCLLVNDLEESLTPMAKKRQNQKQSWEVSFAAVKLDADARVAFTDWVKEQQAHEVDPIYELVPYGWKFSCSFDAENDCYIVSHTQRNEDDRNHNICCVSRSDNPYEALWMNVYKINVLYKGKTLPTEAERDNWG